MTTTEGTANEGKSYAAELLKLLAVAGIAAVVLEDEVIALRQHEVLRGISFIAAIAVGYAVGKYLAQNRSAPKAHEEMAAPFLAGCTGVSILVVAMVLEGQLDVPMESFGRFPTTACLGGLGMIGYTNGRWSPVATARFHLPNSSLHRVLQDSRPISSSSEEHQVSRGGERGDAEAESDHAPLSRGGGAAEFGRTGSASLRPLETPAHSPCEQASSSTF